MKLVLAEKPAVAQSIATLTINSYFTMQYNNSCEEETKDKETKGFSYFSNETNNEELLKQILQGL